MNALANIVRTAWSGIAVNKLRSALTALGVVIGVAMVVTLLAIGEGARASITGRITSVGSNLLFVSPSFRDGGPVQGSAGNASLTTADAAELADPGVAPDVRLVSAEYGRNAQVLALGKNANAQISGVTPAYSEAYDIGVAAGRGIRDEDVTRRAAVAVLGATTAADLFGATDPLGKTVLVALPGDSGQRLALTVIGVLAAKGSSSRQGNPDQAVLVPLTTAQFRLFGARTATGIPALTTITIVAIDGGSDAANAQITAALRRRHRLAVSDADDFRIANQADLLALVGDVSQIFTVFLGAIAAISLLVGGIGIMNIMLVSVTERTREIGIRKAVGARRRDILVQFLGEAVVLSVAGGAIGLGLGTAVAWALSRFELMQTSVTPISLLMALGFAVAVGLVSGVYPARRAAVLTPLEALRYE